MILSKMEGENGCTLDWIRGVIDSDVQLARQILSGGWPIQSKHEDERPHRIAAVTRTSRVGAAARCRLCNECGSSTAPPSLTLTAEIRLCSERLTPIRATQDSQRIGRIDLHVLSLREFSSRSSWVIRAVVGGAARRGCKQDRNDPHGWVWQRNRSVTTCAHTGSLLKILIPGY